jgi:anti-sigma B factor antagonist
MNWRDSIVLSIITTREVDGVSIVAVEGRIVFGEESNALRAEVKGLIAEGKRKIVLNMKSIVYIDSAGLGMLVAAHLSARAHGASLCLCHIGSKFQEVLEMTRLATVFQLYSTEPAAVASFSN